ncbi:MAG: DUF541 domain-containing protein [Clostridiales bacterium]|nr:DUF541 domain-containing protein [Clostridiales bacterium]
MKNFKKVFIVCFLLVCLIGCGLTFVSGKNNMALAEQSCKILMVNGSSKLQATADTCELNFCINQTSESYSVGQSILTEKYESFKQKVLSVDSGAKTYVSCSYCCPVLTEEQSHNMSCNFIVRTNNFESVDSLIGLANDFENLTFCGKTYVLENKNDLYSKALNQAKENCIERANSIYENANLKTLIEINVYSNCNNEFEQNITIEAFVKGIFTVCEQVDQMENQDIETSKNYDDTLAKEDSSLMKNNDSLKENNDTLKQNKVDTIKNNPPKTNDKFLDHNPKKDRAKFLSENENIVPSIEKQPREHGYIFEEN